MISNEKEWCVYKHTNQINNKSYIGITSQVPCHRWGHEGHNYQDQPKFYNAIQKYGWDKFTHEILQEKLTKEDALQLEAKLIIEFNAVENGYNCANEKFSGELYSKAVYCIETLEQFPSVAAAARNRNIDPSHLSNHLHGKKVYSINNEHWYFLDDSLNQEHYASDLIQEEKQLYLLSRKKLFIQLYENGMTIREISALTKSAKETISNALKDANISLRTKKISVTALDKITGEPIKTFESMYDACEWAGLDGRTATGRIKQAIIEDWRECKGYKWTSNNPQLLELREINKTNYSANNPPIELMKQDYQNGMTIEQLTKKYNFCDTSIGRWLKAAGVQLASGGKQPVVAINPDTHQIIQEYTSIGDVYRSWDMNPNNQTLGKRCKDHKKYHDAIWYYKQDYDELLKGESK